MEINKGLLSTFFFLAHLYKEVYKENYEYLEMIVSDADFFIWAPDSEGYISPADIGEMSEWIQVYKVSQIKIKKKLNSKEIFAIMILYLKFHSKEYGFELEQVIKLLEDMVFHPDNHKNLWDEWEKSFKKAKGYKVIPFSLNSRSEIKSFTIDGVNIEYVVSVENSKKEKS